MKGSRPYIVEMAETVYSFVHTPREARFSYRLTTFPQKNAIVPSLLHKEGKELCNIVDFGAASRPKDGVWPVRDVTQA